MFDAGETRMIWATGRWKSYDNMLRHYIWYRDVTGGQTDRINIARQCADVR